MGIPHMWQGSPMALTLFLSLVLRLPLVLLRLPIYAPYIRPSYTALIRRLYGAFHMATYTKALPSMGLSALPKHSMISV